MSTWRNPRRDLTIALSVLLVLGALGSTGWVYWKGTSAGPSPPLPIHYGETFTYHRPWRRTEAAPAPPSSAPVAALWGDNTVTQSFRAGADNLAQVRVWLAGLPGTEVFAELRDGRERADALYHARLRLHPAEQGRYYSLTFPRLQDSQGRMYYLVLWSSAPSREESAAVRTTTGERVGGTFFVNELPHPGTLDFATYHRGWPGLWTLDAVGESILPAVFRDRLSQYKPELFKSPAFGVLLILTGVGAIGLLLSMLVWQGVRHRGVGIGLALLLLGALMVIISRSVVLPSYADVPAHAGPGEALAVGGGERIYRDLLAALQSASRKPDPRLVATQWRDGKALIVVPPESKLSYSTYVPPGGKLRFAVALLDDAGPGVTFSVAANDDVLWAQHTQRRQDVVLDLEPYAGEHIRLSLATEQGDQERDTGGLWLAPQLTDEMDWLLAWPLPAQPESSQVTKFGDGIELLGYDLDTSDARPGGTVRLTLYWRALQPIDDSYTVFVHLLDEAGNIRGQQDSHPLNGAYPTNVWPVDAVVQDEHAVPVADDAALGEYQIAVGLYELETMVRLPAYDTDGLHLENDVVRLGKEIQLVQE